MDLLKVYNAYMKLSVYGKEPEIGEYFGVITDVNYLEPYYSDGILYKCDILDYNIFNYDGQHPFLFKRIDEDTIVDVLTGIPFVFGPSCRHYKDAAKQQEQFQKYRKIGLYFDPITYYRPDHISCFEGNNVYLKADEKFKMLYSEEMGKGLKEKLKFYAEEAHKRFDNALTKTINTAHGIASVDNAIYDMEQKCKTKSLTKPNDDQK